MIKYLLDKSSDNWELVLDPFLWSWTTAVACKELGRNFIGIEKEQKYVDIANKRLNYTTTSLF
jgi:site-specific DNA-methyltransferase (adenine-specific)